MGKKTSNNTDAEGVAVWMQSWEKGLAATWMQRELSYRCSRGSSRVMGSNIGCNSVEDVGQGGLASTQGLMLDDQGDTQ